MDDRRLLALPADLVEEIDANRGDLGRVEFIRLLLERALQGGEAKGPTPQHVGREELEGFKQDMRTLLRTFLDFFIAYGLELGASPKGGDLQELQQKLRESFDTPGRPRKPAVS